MMAALRMSRRGAALYWKDGLEAAAKIEWPEFLQKE